MSVGLFSDKWIYLLKIFLIFMAFLSISCQIVDFPSDDSDFNDSDLSATAKIKQSNECTVEEIEKNVQCFQEIPQPKYEVAQGSAATLRCIVRNQHGKVQWRAVPVLLGYDRNIPGRPRYRVVGSVVRGEHFLEIRDVQIKDGGDYECQVQPVGQLHPLLRRKTKLVVLVRPSPPKIFFKSVMPMNDQIIINSTKPETRSTFVCESYNGQPKVTFTWFLNNKPVKDGEKSFLIETIGQNQSKMSSLTSNLKDGDVIRCRVSNRATEVHQDPQKQQLDIDVVVVVYVPPGLPRLDETNRIPGFLYNEGDVIKATCTTSPPGKPAGNILWRWKFPKSRELFNSQLENFTVKDVSPQFYQQSIHGNQLISKIELPPLTSQYHGAQLFCVASNPVMSYQSVAIKVNMKYAPSEVVISVSDGSIMTRNIGTDGLTETVVFGEAGEQKTLTCTTATYYDEAMIKWQIQHSLTSSETFSLSPVEKVWKEGESFRRNSTIKVTIDKQLDKSYLDCQAWSGGKRVDARVKLDISYPPEKPVITGLQRDAPVKLNEIVTLTCSTNGGNPFPKLQWFRENKPIDSTFSAQQFGKQKSLKIKISASITDNNAKYFCQAKSVTLKNSPLNSHEITLVVKFPPSTINLRSLSGNEVENGNILTVQCIAGESNPPAVVKWKINRCGQMMSELGRRPVQTSCTEEDLSKQNLVSTHNIVAGKFGGSLIKSNLEIRTNWKDHLDYIDCEIYNPDYGKDYQVLRKRIQINVTFPPQFEGHFDMHIKQGQSRTFNLEPIANPPVQRYRWFVGSSALEQPLRSKSLSTEKAKLSISNADPSDMGNYTLVVSNERGESRITIFLNVTYRPIIIGDKFEIVTNNRQNADLECSVRSNPANPHLSYKWVKLVPSKGFNDVSNSDLIPAFTIGCNQAEWKGTPDKSNFKYFSKCNLKSQFEMTSLLIVYDVDRNDVGLYKCIVNNGIGEDVTKTIELIRYFTPQILALPKFSKAAGNHGSSVSLFCYIRAEPKPKITWIFGRYNSTISSNSKYRISITRYRPGFYVAQLIIGSLQRTDHGNYRCKAENLNGTDIHQIEISGTSSPDIPLELQVINKSVNSIEISWMQGFDGGSPQTFQVRWKEKSANSLYRYEDVASDDSKIVLTFLIIGLKSDTMYYISINSRNPNHGKSDYTKELIASTLNAVNEIDSTQVTYPIISSPRLQDNTILFIVAASVFGFVILVVNILVIIFVLRRRRQRSRTAKLEARYNNPKSLLAASNGLILSRDDSLKDSNFNYLRSDMVELCSRGLDSSQILHHNPHQMHSLRRSIPDDQKTFSSFETGSDDAREDLLRKQKEYVCCGIDPSSQQGSIILTYDPVTNSSYYAPVSATSPASMYLQHGMYDQDTMSTLLSPIHEGGQRQLMTFMNMIPVNSQRNSSSCGSVNSGGNYSNNPQNIVTNNNISPAGSVIVSDSNNPSGSFSDNLTNIHPGFHNGTMDQNNLANLNSFNNNTTNATPYRSRVVSPTMMSYNIAPQHREVYANELRKAQLTGNIVVNPAMFNRHTTTSPHHLIGNSPLISSQMINSSMPMTYENMTNSNITMNNCGGNMKGYDSKLNSHIVPTTNEGKVSQKYRCLDNDINGPNQTSDPSIEFVNPAMEDSMHKMSNSDSQYLPRPNMI